MLTLSITIPEEVSQLYHNPEVLKQIIIEAFVASEYEKGNLSIRQGANILGLTYEGFMLDFLGKRQIPLSSGSQAEREVELQQERLWLDEVLGVAS